jgi:hypothetical protein
MRIQRAQCLGWLLFAAATVGACGTVAAPSGSQPTEPAPNAPAVIATAEPVAGQSTPPVPRRPAYREVQLPAGTELPLRLDSPVASDASRVEDEVRATVRRDIVVDGVPIVPAGSDVSGSVTDAKRSAKVEGRARVAFRFGRLVVDDEAYRIRTSVVSRVARGTKKKDATKIGIGAGAGALVGAITGGGRGAAIGSAVGAGAGTGVVLATRGEEVRLAPGTPVTVRLVEPVTIRIRVD